MPRILPVYLCSAPSACSVLTTHTADKDLVHEVPEKENQKDTEVSKSEATSRETGPLWPHCVLVVTAALLCYINSLHGDLVHDDVMAIRKNNDVTGNGSLWTLLSNDFWGRRMSNPVSHKSYRPLTVLTFR